MEKYKIEKNSVQETLIIPLYGRRLCSQRFPELYQDTTAAMLIEKVEYDFSRLERHSNSLMHTFGALELVGLTEFRKRLAKKYSLGMKQRLGLAGALIGRPPILILDEPTNGLDPVGIHEIRTLIRSLPQKYDCTVLVSSHLLPEVELMADDIGILNHGHLLFEGTKEELKTNARAAGFPTDNLEDTFLAMIDEDNRRRGGTV